MNKNNNYIGGKTRKGPSESATKYKVGTRKLGNDGNMWIIKKASNGVQRWSKIKNNSTKKIKSKSINKTISKKDKDISVEKLKQLKKKYQVLVSGSKSARVPGVALLSGGRGLRRVLAHSGGPQASTLHCFRFHEPLK